jgi:hypothetical protein
MKARPKMRNGTDMNENRHLGGQDNEGNVPNNSVSGKQLNCIFIVDPFKVDDPKAR